MKVAAVCMLTLCSSRKIRSWITRTCSARPPQRHKTGSPNAIGKNRKPVKYSLHNRYAALMSATTEVAFMRRCEARRCDDSDFFPSLLGHCAQVKPARGPVGRSAVRTPAACSLSSRVAELRSPFAPARHWQDVRLAQRSAVSDSHALVHVFRWFPWGPSTSVRLPPAGTAPKSLWKWHAGARSKRRCATDPGQGRSRPKAGAQGRCGAGRPSSA